MIRDRPPTIAGHLRGAWRAYAFGAVCVAANELAMNRIDWASKAAIDRAFLSSGGSAIAPGLVMIGLAVLAFGLNVLGYRSVFRGGFRIEHELRARLIRKLHTLGPSFYRRFSPGEIMSRAVSDLGKIGSSFGAVPVNVLHLVFGVVSSLQVMLLISVRLSVVSMATMPLVFVITRVFSTRLLSQSRASEAQLAGLAEVTERYVSSVRTVRSFALDAFAESQLAGAAKRYLAALMRLARTRGTLSPLLGLAAAASMFSAAWYGAYQLKRGPGVSGGLGPGDYFAFLLAWVRLYVPISNLGTVVPLAQSGRASFERLGELLAIAPDVLEPIGTPAPVQGSPGLRVERLRYEAGGRAILDDVSFSLPAGETLAIFGRTGSGKSTLASLLVRLSPAPRGTIFFDGRDLADLDRETLRKRVAYAQQDTFLFSTSIADNVAIGLDPTASVDELGLEIAQALRDAQIAEEVAAMSEGRDTRVGERGARLSGGQRQRVALARALVGRAPLQILDDPLSAVDARTGAAILAALRGEATRSLILVTHHVATAACCDRVLVLDEGRVVQLGTHLELMSQPGLYRQLADGQQLAGAAERGPPAPSDSDARPDPGEARADPELEELASSDPRLLARLWPFTRGARLAMFASLLALAGVVALNVLRPLEIGRLTEAATAGGALHGPGLALLAVLAGGSTLSALQGYLAEVAGARALLSLRLRTFGVITRLGLRVLDRTPVGRLVARVVYDVEGVGGLLANAVLFTLGNTVSLLAMAGAMLWIDWQLALGAFASLPLAVLITAFFSRRARSSERTVRAKTAELSSMFNEQVRGIAVIQTFGRQQQMAQRLDEVSARYRDARTSGLVANVVSYSALTALYSVCLAAVLLWAAHVGGTGAAIPFAVIVTFSQYLRYFYDPLSAIGASYAIVQTALASAERIFGFLDSTELEPPEEAADEALSEAVTDSDQGFAFHHVDFSYRDGQPILRDLCLNARRRERVAIVGATGAGKSTIAQLLLRLYDVDAGAVTVFGVDVRKWPRETLRRSFAVVPQEVVLFPGTLLENIALGDENLDRTRALWALERVGLRARIEQREGGLDAPVNERAMNFSAGERQLLSFARALYRDAPLLLLDEATASVDSDTEAQIQDALDRVLRGRTTLVIAHRLSTIEKADRILVVEDGRFVETGTHAQLIAAGGSYARLHALQRRGDGA
jgi:ATP-binding cassette subfamily B multidrug efflux pump